MQQGVPSPIVGKKILDFAEVGERSLTPLQILKLVFLAHGWGYVVLERPLIIDPVEAWQLGPVHKKLYHIIKVYGSGPVEEIVFEGDKNDRTSLYEDEVELIEFIYKKYGKMSGSSLVDLTHETGSPWDQTKDRVPYFWDREIDQSIIRKYYKDEFERICNDG